MTSQELKRKIAELQSEQRHRSTNKIWNLAVR